MSLKQEPIPHLPQQYEQGSPGALLTVASSHVGKEGDTQIAPVPWLMFVTWSLSLIPPGVLVSLGLSEFCP